MHGEGCMPQAATLRMSLLLPLRNEWTEWMSAPHEYDMCPSNLREEPIDGLSLLQLGKIRIRLVACLILEHAEVARCFRCLGYGHGSRGCCNPNRNNVCWRCGATGHLTRSCQATPRCLTCLDRGDKDIAPVSGGGSCPVFWEVLRRLRGRNWSSCNSISERGKDAQDLLMQTARERGADVILISEQYKWSENSAWFQDASRISDWSVLEVITLSDHRLI